MASTYKQVLNRVLAIIGETQIGGAESALSGTYQMLLGAMLNDVKEEIEDGHNWRALRQILTPTVTAGDLSAVLTGANERSRLVRIAQQDNSQLVPLVFDITDTANPVPLTELDLSELLYRDHSDPDTRTSRPTYFAIDNTSGDGMSIMIYPRTTGDIDLKVTMTVPQDYLADTALNTTISIPIRPLFVGAAWYALEERGEELGVQGVYNAQRFEEALATAISRDSAESGDTFELVIT